ncbi:MAG: glycosyltransferase family 2 protein [Deltaproteobacteria bacterium]
MRFAVVIPKFNHAEYYRKTIDSVLQQTIPPDLVILSEGNSTDGSKNEALALTSKYPGKLITTSAPHGSDLAQNHMHGLSLVPDSIDYTAFLASDDLWEPKFIENISRSLSFYQSLTPINCIYSGALMIDDTSMIYSASGGWRTHSVIGFEDAFNFHLQGCRYLMSGAFFKTSFLKENVDFFQRCAHHLDLILSLESGRKGYIIFCPLHLLKYRTTSSISRKHSILEITSNSILRLYSQFLRKKGDETHALRVENHILIKENEMTRAPNFIMNHPIVTKLISSFKIVVAKLHILYGWRLIQLKYLGFIKHRFSIEPKPPNKTYSE